MPDPGRIHFEEKKKHVSQPDRDFFYVQESIIETLELNPFEVEELFYF